MSGLGDGATALANDALRSIQTNVLRPHPDQLIRTLARETRSLADQLATGQQVFSQIESDDGQVCALLIAALAMRRNKRVMLAHQAQRTDKLRELFWSAGGQTAAVLGQATESRKNMAPAEVDFVRGYATLVNDYKAAFSKAGLDLTAPTAGRPPKELFVQVRVLKDVGDVETEWGTVSFTKDSLVFVRRPDVERLILDGYLEVVT